MRAGPYTLEIINTFTIGTGWSESHVLKRAVEAYAHAIATMQKHLQNPKFDASAGLRQIFNEQAADYTVARQLKAEEDEYKKRVKQIKTQHA